MERLEDLPEITGSDDLSEVEFPDINYVKIDVCGLVKKMKSKRRKTYSVNREVKQVRALVGTPPKSDECYKLVSAGGFSSIGIIKYIAETEGIDTLYASSFRIGMPHFETMKQLHQQGKLNKCGFITSLKQAGIDSAQSIDYFNLISDECHRLGWSIKAYNNHSKIILIKTKKNYYVIETSSNLNENPKMEQFSWENDKSLYEWYESIFIELLK